MLKKFLVGLVVLCSSSVANAALLVSYNFAGANTATSWTPVAGDYGPTGASPIFPQSVSQVLSAGAFTNYGVPSGNGIDGAINNSRWRTAANIAVIPNQLRGNQLTFDPLAALGDGTITIDSMSFNMGKTTVGNGNLVNVAVEYRSSPSAAWVGVGSGVSLGNATLNPTSITFATPIVIDKNSPTSAFRFVWSRTNVLTGSNSGQADLDDVSFFGAYTPPTFVPEPASLAVFGSLAAFGLLGRYRRK